jgi:hypothetical protein
MKNYEKRKLFNYFQENSLNSKRMYCIERMYCSKVVINF